MKSNQTNVIHSDSAARRGWPVANAVECVSVATILQTFGYTFSQLVAVCDSRADPWADREKLAVEIRGARSRLLLTVECTPEEGGPGAWDIRLLHSVNPFGPQSFDQFSVPEYETSNVYLAAGRHTRQSRLRFESDRDLIAAYARQSMIRVPDDDPFIQWQWVRNLPPAG